VIKLFDHIIIEEIRKEQAYKYFKKKLRCIVAKKDIKNSG
jgi:hypothetical protein